MHNYIQQTLCDSSIKVLSESTINTYLKEIGSISYYACYPVIQSFLNSSIRQSFFYNDELITRKHKTNPQFGVCFRVNDTIANTIKANSYLFLPKKRNPNDTVEIEYIYDNNHISELINKNVRNSYNYASAHYDIGVRDLSQVDVGLLYSFLNEWKLEHKEYFRLTIKRDYSLLKLKRDLLGTVAIDNNTKKVVGYEINTPCVAQEDLCINVFRKGLVAYKNIDCFVKVEGSKRMLERGYKYSNDSTASTSGLKHFKGKLLDDVGSINKIFYSKINEK